MNEFRIEYIYLNVDEKQTKQNSNIQTIQTNMVYLNLLVIIIIPLLLFNNLYINYASDDDNNNNKHLMCTYEKSEALQWEMNQTLENIVERHGYKLLVYHVITEDGYILDLHRVVPKNFIEYFSNNNDYNNDNDTNMNIVTDINNNNNTNKPFIRQHNFHINQSYARGRQPVIVLHGFLSSSIEFFINNFYQKDGRDNFGLALLATNRYDVWLPNLRGNGVSNAHISINNTETKFWEFSLDEMAEYDLPAVIDVIVNETGHQNNINFVGRGTGGAIGLAMASLLPQVGQKLRTLVAWAPTVYVNWWKSRFNFLTYFTPLLMIPGKYRYDCRSLANIINEICTWKLINDPSCLYKAMYGQTNRMNVTRIPVIEHYGHSSTSNWFCAHTDQISNRDRFIRFDYYCKNRNLQKYNQSTPPDYPLHRLPTETLSVAIFYSYTDNWVSPDNAKRLIDELRGYYRSKPERAGKLTEVVVETEQWNHVDYVVGMGAYDLVYKRTIEILDSNRAPNNITEQ